MRVSVIDPPFSDIHYVYKVDVETPFSSWSVIKRFSQFLEIDKELRNDFASEMNEIVNLPKKKLMGSLDPDIKSERATVLNVYLSEISKENAITKSQTIARFLRSDVYLESYIDLVEGDELREIKLRADKLLEKSNNLLNYCNENQSEISNTYEQFNKCEQDINTLKKKLDNTIITLDRLSFLRSKNREVKAELLSNLNSSVENYKNISQLLNVSKYNIWKRISNMSFIKEDLMSLSASINTLAESLNKVAPRANSSDINDIRTIVKNLKNKSDKIIVDITSTQK